MKRRKFDETCRREFAERGGGRIVAGGFGGFGEPFPPELIAAMAGDRFDVVQHAPDHYEFVAKEPGKSPLKAA